MTEVNAPKRLHILELELDTAAEPRRYQYESCEPVIWTLNRLLEDICTGKKVTQIEGEFIMIKNIVSFRKVSE